MRTHGTGGPPNGSAEGRETAEERQGGIGEGELHVVPVLHVGRRAAGLPEVEVAHRARRLSGRGDRRLGDAVDAPAERRRGRAEVALHLEQVPGTVVAAE